MDNMRVTIEGDVLAVSVDLGQEIRRHVDEHQQAAELGRTRWEESEWYLNETRATLREREQQYVSLQHAYEELGGRCRAVGIQLEQATRERDEAHWYLGEARAAHASLLRDVDRLMAQLAQAGDALEETRRASEESRQFLDLERAQRRELESELFAIRAHGERRRALRIRQLGGMVELHSSDGALLFRGRSRDVSATGLGFAAEQAIGAITDSLQVRLHMAGARRPIEAIGRLAWREHDPMSTGCIGGCELLDMPAESLEDFEQVLATSG